MRKGIWLAALILLVIVGAGAAAAALAWRSPEHSHRASRRRNVARSRKRHVAATRSRATRRTRRTTPAVAAHGICACHGRRDSNSRRRIPAAGGHYAAVAARKARVRAGVFASDDDRRGVAVRRTAAHAALEPGQSSQALSMERASWPLLASPACIRKASSFPIRTVSRKAQRISTCYDSHTKLYSRASMRRGSRAGRIRC